MSDRACDGPLSTAELAAYMLGELAGEDQDRVELHLFQCEACGCRLAALSRLGRAVADLVRAGGVSASVPPRLLESAATRGLQIRRYRLAPGERVQCTAGPEDDFVAVQLDVQLAPGETVDIAAEGLDLTSGATQTTLAEDVVLDRERAQVIILYPGESIRALPRSRWTLEALVRGPAGERRLGPYTMDHTPWEQLHADG
jgi:predicted anti-sigma-YlaC factor YlaD